MSENEISPEVRRMAENLKRDLLQEKLPPIGRKDWSDETKAKIYIARIKKLQDKIDRFNITVKNMRNDLELKILKLSENWAIEEALVEIENLREGTLLLFDGDSINESESDSESENQGKLSIKNPFTSSEDES